MPFAKALDRLGKGDALLYMTTQDAPIGPDDHPEVLAPPLSHLATDFPLRPRLMGSLVPQQINIWAGVAGAVGSSSGLHHDYHDNLYIVIRGRKRFRLFPPSLLPCMYTNGQPIKIYDNGRIVYNGQRDVLADGSDADDVRLWKARRRAEAQLEAAEEASRRREPFSDEMLAKAEEDLDQVMEDIMERWQLLRKEDRRKKTGRASDSQSQDHEPESFSRIDLSLPEDEMNRCFPLFPGASAALECEVKAGQMLYLPAGWFHEVTSFRDDTHQANGSSMHLALNYWFHPPDNLQAGEKGFSHPYTSEYWPELWESRKCRYETKFAALKRKGELIRGAHAHFLDGIRGLFGYGRRQHLHRFVNVHFKKRNKTQ